MRNLFNIDAPIIQWVTKVSLLIWMNTLWLVCCLPVFTIGASTAAMYRMAINLREDKECSAKAFFKAFCGNFKQATLIWLLLLLCAALILVAYYGAVLVEHEIVRLVLVLIVCVILLLWACVLLYSFPVTCYFENTLKNTLRNALGMGLGNLRQTVCCMALAFVPLTALLISPYWFLRLLYIWLLFYPGFCAYWICLLLKPVFARYSEN